jgi:putative ABC transport system permease protein
LLIATANVGTLLLLRAARRTRETAVRMTLGASRARLAGQLILESMMLSLIGAAAGLVLSRWFGEALRVTLLPAVARDERFVDQRVVFASIAVSSLAGLLAAVSPLLQLRRRDLSAALRSGGEHGSSARFGSQSLLVGIQVALCTVLLIGAGLFVRSLERVRSQNLGFTTEGILYVTVDLQGQASGRERDEIYLEAARRVRGLNGVVRATPVEAFPFGPFHVPPMNIPGISGMPTLGGQPPFMYAATPEYLAMMNVTLTRGRLFTDRDGAGNPRVVLVNESMARTIWPGESAIGKCIRAGYPDNMEGFDDPMTAVAFAPCREVVGIVRDTRARSLRGEGNEAKQMQFYVPFEQIPAPPMPGFARTNGIFVQVTDDRARAAVQRAVQAGLTRPGYARARAYQDLIDPQLRSWKLGASLFSVFGALALGIAAVGLFGVISYLVAQRTRELGVRIALGAGRDGVWRLVITDSVKLVVAGIAVGVMTSMAAGPLIRDLLFRTSPWEVANAATAIVILLTVTIAAAAWPAWRASRVDPLTALRSDG